jgi:excisionase family DNA binding protein
MTVTEAAKVLGLNPATLRLQLKLRKMRGHKMGRTWYVTAAEVERYARENQRQPKDAA